MYVYIHTHTLCWYKDKNLHCTVFIPVLKLSCELLIVGSFLLVPAVPPVIFVSLVAAAQALQSVSVSISGTSPLGHSLTHKPGICPYITPHNDDFYKSFRVKQLNNG